ncbi:MAG TPA: ATPase, T2SS/T4P/T4SS family [Kiritimatiellia bacterium]|nr:ATPase, T2SS/T4P/T4SS family [Kiritimatiellia bacterium]HMO98203.1 ATPase, T2SS/T4P/T4SS family [Kiritimatiellia bacterium]HMP96479.1 ATPase, T2SS/T4P/T4SS family [Kiritimatiellia bacterium]
MALATQSKIGALLEATALFTEEQVDTLVGKYQEEDKAITDLVIDLGYAKDDVFLRALAGVMAIPFVRLNGLAIDKAALERLPTKAVFQYNVIPTAVEEGVLRVATHDPFLPGLLDALRLASGMRVRLALSPANDIAKAAKQFYGIGADTFDRMMADSRIEVTAEDDISKQDLSELDQEASVVKFVNQIIWEAHKDRATDIHLEPQEMDLRIRYRVDGVLHPIPVPPQLKRFQSAIISRIKVMANMDIAEKRLPQDGRISLRVQGEEIDVRVSTMPTVYGESVSLRLLMRSSGMLGLDKLGMAERDTKLLLKLITKPHGILLVTGPTGSGKSTSLYAWLHTINSTDLRILTIEDPIEYEMAGVNQINVKSEIGMTFAVGLRHILRQDPDVIMVGEIRDKETAEIAIRAALTGHLVFSTLHTNDAAGAVTRLIDMGIEPFLVASSVEGLVAQRLVRRLCPACKKPRTVDTTFLQSVGFPVERLSEGTIYEPAGCEDCRGTGFRGRTGVYELIVITDVLRPLIVARASSNEIKAMALREGMHTLRDDGWNKVLAGVTTIEEVLRVTEEDEALSGE